MKISRLGFPVRYNVRVDSSADHAHAFHVNRGDSDRDDVGLLSHSTPRKFLRLRVCPDDASDWVGQFEFGWGGLTGIFGTPRASVALVVVSGQGYWVCTTSPESTKILASPSIQKVLGSSELSKIFVADHTHVVCYDIDGLQWESRDLSWDGVELDEIRSGYLFGRGRDAPTDSMLKFKIEIQSGELEGGASPIG